MQEVDDFKSLNLTAVEIENIKISKGVCVIELPLKFDIKIKTKIVPKNFIFFLLIEITNNLK